MLLQLVAQKFCITFPQALLNKRNKQFKFYKIFEIIIFN